MPNLIQFLAHIHFLQSKFLERLAVGDREENDDFDSAAAAQEKAEPEARSIDNTVPQAQDPAVASYTFNDVMAICKHISARIVKRPDVTTCGHASSR
jgi:hypothetical protein